MAAARTAALDTLRAVSERDAYANLVLPALLAERGTDGRDAALATELAYGTLRWRGTLDLVLARCLDRPVSDLDGPVLDVLRLGAYQLLRTRVPAHAAVAESVEQARQVCGEGPSRLVNAVLRRVAERDEPGWHDLLVPAEDPVGRLSVLHAHPRWVVSAFRDALGGDLDETALALAADNVPAPVHLVARPGLVEPGELLAAAGPGAEPGPWSPYAVRGGTVPPRSVGPVRDGRAGVQDEGSQVVALALAEAELDGPDLRWLDLCAGPGGKAALLAGLAAGGDGRLLALERSPRRAAMVADAVRLLPADVVVADGTAPPVRPGSFDRVLVDVPCTGLGALRRRPEARWRKQPGDLPGLGRLQRDLLAAGLRATRRGGAVCYATCSPHLAETRVVVADLLRDRRDVEVMDAAAGLSLPADARVAGPGGGAFVQLWPHRHGTDAMFVALLRRS